MILERRTVSRKTPLDGKLEVSSESAARIGPLGPDIPLTTGGHTGSARLHTLACTCGKGSAGSHVHHFLESPLFRTLRPESEIRVTLNVDRGLLVIEPG